MAVEGSPTHSAGIEAKGISGKLTGLWFCLKDSCLFGCLAFKPAIYDKVLR